MSSDMGPVLDDFGPDVEVQESSSDLEHGKEPEEAHKRRWRFRVPLYMLEDRLDAVRNFSPSFFIMSSTTGLEGLLFALCPYFGKWSIDLGFAIWWFSVCVFFVFLLILIGRFVLLRREVKHIAVSRDPDLFFFALVVIAWVIVVEGFAKYMPHYFGTGLDIAGIALWWSAFAFSIAMMVFIPFCLAHFSTAELHAVLPLWILMTVPGSATAAVGGEISGLVSLEYASAARHLVYANLLILGLSCAMAAIVISLVAHRLFLRGFPPHGMIMSVFFPVAPLALLGDAFVELAVGLPRLFPDDNLDSSGPFPFGAKPIATLCLLIGIAIFGFTIWWILMAISAISVTLFNHRRIPYGPAWWGAAFPVGLNGLLAFRLGDLLEVEAFHVVGAALSLVSVTAWATTFTATTCYAYSGRLFVKPGTRTKAC